LGLISSTVNQDFLIIGCDIKRNFAAFCRNGRITANAQTTVLTLTNFGMEVVSCTYITWHKTTARNQHHSYQNTHTFQPRFAFLSHPHTHRGKFIATKPSQLHKHFISRNYILLHFTKNLPQTECFE